MNPKFKFFKDDVNATIDIKWDITNSLTKKIIDQNLFDKPLSITVVSRNVFCWDLRKGDNQRFPLEFLLASLTAWTEDPGIKDIESISSLLQRLEPASGLAEVDLYHQWFSRCYSVLFESSPSPLIVRPYNRSWPPSGQDQEADQTIRSPKEILELGQPDSIEAALLIAAIRKSNKYIPPGSRLIFLALAKRATTGAGQKDFLLAWSSDDTSWYAIDMTNPNQINFEQNEADTSIRVRDLFNSDNAIMATLKQKGVYINNEVKVLALDFEKAMQVHQIGGLRKSS